MKWLCKNDIKVSAAQQQHGRPMDYSRMNCSNGWRELISDEPQLIQKQETEKGHVHVTVVRLRMNN